MKPTDRLRPEDPVRPWRCDDAEERVSSCRAMLYLHGFITDAQNEQIKRRIKRWLAEPPAPQRDPAKEGQ